MMRKFLLPAMLFLLAIPAKPQEQEKPSLKAGGGSSQQASPQQNQQPPPIVTRTETVVVPVTVKDKNGQLVGDLQKTDFRIFSDGIEQAITKFSSESVPLSAVVVIDNDLPDRAVSQVQKSLESIAASFGPRDEVALITYDEFPTTVFEFSSNNDQLFTQLKRLELNSHPTQIISDPTTAGPFINGRDATTGVGLPLHGAKRPRDTSALDDAIYSAGDLLKRRERDRRKIIFLISDGSNSHHNVHTFAETLRSLLEADVSVYSISITRQVPVGRSLVQRGASDLDKFAAGTGGDTFFASKQPDLERLYSDVTEEARNEYTLTFSPQEEDRSKDFHSIEVRVERPSLTIETRAGYYQSAISVGH